MTAPRHLTDGMRTDRPLRRKLQEKIGGWPTPTAPKASLLNVRAMGGFVCEELSLQPTRATAAWPGEPIPALLTRPAVAGPYPAVLYIHAHGGHYGIGCKELIDGREALPEGPYAAPLADQGVAALCIDLPCFGARQAWRENDVAKQLLWRGDTLFGAMLRELATALDYLMSRPDIDGTRLAALGLSMGSTLAWWLAALDKRIAAVAELCCLADLSTLIDQDAHGRHGLYMMVPGLARDHATAEIAGLIAPRPHLACIGAKDLLTPKLAVDRVIEPLAEIYADLGSREAFETLIEPDSGHVETARMRRAVLDFLGRNIGAKLGGV